MRTIFAYIPHTLQMPSIGYIFALSMLFSITPISITPVFGATTFTGQAWVIDGDSLRLTLSDFTKKEVRLFAIDAPEMSTKKGQVAKKVLIQLIKAGGRTVTCTQVARDMYKRYVSICKNKKGDLAENMLKKAQATVYTYFIKKAPLDLQKRYFKAQKAGRTRVKP